MSEEVRVFPSRVTPHHDAAVTNVAETLGTNAGVFLNANINNPNASTVYLHIYDTTTGVTVGTTVPLVTLAVGASFAGLVGTGYLHRRRLDAVGDGMSYAVTTTRTGGVAAGSTVDLTIYYA